jgi:hypothetical protein
MNRLLEMQRQFSRYVLQMTDSIPSGIRTNGIAPEQRLSIYRNNTRLGLTEALRETYPVVNKLVGEAFFNRLAQAYLNAQPLPTACLLEYGGQFAEVITGFEAAQGLAYLPDIARLEWFCHEAYHEADAGFLQLSSLAQLNPADHNRIGFKLHPSLRLMASNYPIAQIWACNQPDYQADTLIDLKQGGCCLLIYRPAFDVEIISLEIEDYQCLTALATGASFTQAVAQTLADHPDFTVQTCLQNWLHKGLLTDFFII